MTGYTRRRIIALSGAALSIVATQVISSAGTQSPAAAEVTVYASSTCGCCLKWVAHLREHGFNVTTQLDFNLAAIKAPGGITPELASCHTAFVDGYVVEGHVPADLIHRMLNERPEVVGLTVPGMPRGSAGMEGPRPERYTVLAFDRAGNAEVYAIR